MCEPEWKANILGSLFAMGHVSSLLIVPHLADKLGRKWIYTVSRLVDCLCFVALLVSRSYTLSAAALTILGVCTAGRLNVGNVYLSEWFPRRTQTFVLCVRLIEQASIFTLVTLYFWLFGNEWVKVGYVGMGFCVLSMAATYFVPESPRLLLAQGKLDEFKRAIETLARWNRKKVEWSGSGVIELEEWVKKSY